MNYSCKGNRAPSVPLQQAIAQFHLAADFFGELAVMGGDDKSDFFLSIELEQQFLNLFAKLALDLDFASNFKASFG